MNYCKGFKVLFAVLAVVKLIRLKETPDLRVFLKAWIQLIYQSMKIQIPIPPL